MKIIRGLSHIRPEHYGAAITIGKFDGVHLGHQQLFKEMVAYTQASEGISMVIIFEPSPRVFFNQGVQNERRLSTLSEKCFYLDKAQIDYVLLLPFNQSLAYLSAEHFIEKILINTLRIAKLWVGDDFKFGYQRQGDYQLLQRYSQQYDFQLAKIASYFVEDKRVSSSTIRRLIQDKHFSQAERLLGHPFSVSGYVVKGRQLGQTMGYPTANLGITHRHKSTLALMDFGVYYVRMYIYDLKNRHKYLCYDGVANYGIKPTIDDQSALSFETYCFDLDQSIYQHFVRIEIRQFIRPEKKFASMSQLMAQIQCDVNQGKTLSQNTKFRDV